MVLTDNSDQNDLMGTSRANAAGGAQCARPPDPSNSRSAAASTANWRRCRRTKEIRRRQELGIGLTSPELATLMAHVKLALKDEVLATDLPDQEVFAARSAAVLPDAAARTASPPRSATTSCAARSSPPCWSTTSSTSAASPTPTASPRMPASDTSTRCARSPPPTPSSASGRSGAASVRRLTAGVPVAATDRMTLDLRRLLDRSARWLLNYRPQPLAVGAEINRFAAKVAALSPLMPKWLRGDDQAIVAKEAGGVRSHGAPDDLAYTVAAGLYRYSLLDVIDIADIVDLDPAEVADTYFALMDYLGTDGLLTAVSNSRATTAGMRWPDWRCATTSTVRCARCASTCSPSGSPTRAASRRSPSGSTATPRGWNGRAGP